MELADIHLACGTAGHSPLGQSTFFGTQDEKHLCHCKKPMKNAADRGKSWNFIRFGFSLGAVGQKTEIRYSVGGRASLTKAKITKWGSVDRSQSGRMRAGTRFESGERRRHSSLRYRAARSEVGTV
ncbi:hypothetical protein AVEN_26292-1 [Araneus ventricosus]|uniref:Uncharacterized protein n=1 Tax=Araneus ventricosus TaxID=182803 RepID=A0A4Y2AM24_ARAVE|nr:hypothetical protein AVEN_26292-1 [Araneus ventricosus]